MTRHFGPSPRAGFQARRPTRSPHDLRADWIAAVAEAGMLASQAQEAGELPRMGPFGQGLTRMTARLRDLDGANFPAPGETARRYAAAFLSQARGFAHPATPPETRTACAPALKASARLLDQWLADLRASEAGPGRRVLGEREDD